MVGRITENDFLFITSGVLSIRIGEEWMDGRSVLLSQPIKYVPPWNNNITFDKLSSDNLLPFYVPLRDDQVGHLSHYARSSKKTVRVAKENWGPAYTRPTINTKDQILNGGPPLAEFIDPCLPLTYTSSDRVMHQRISGLKKSSPKKSKAKNVRVEQVLPKKREASVQEDEKIGGASKKPCLGVGSMVTIKGQATPNNAPVFERKPCLFVENVPIKEALSFYGCLVENAHQSQQRSVDSEVELRENKRQWNKNYDKLPTKWQVRLTKKSKEVEKLKVDLAVSDSLLKASKTTVSKQDKKLQLLEHTEALLEEKESTIKDPKAQLAESQSQARAMLNPLFYGETSSSRTNKKPSNPADKADTKPTTPIPKLAGTKTPTPSTSDKPQTLNAPTHPLPPKHPRPIAFPHHQTRAQQMLHPSIQNQWNSHSRTARPLPLRLIKPKHPVACTKSHRGLTDEAAAATTPSKLTPYQRRDRQLNGARLILRRSRNLRLERLMDVKERDARTAEVEDMRSML
ncbi:hypothetical protein N7G274_001323 [Stereocaulon virgatum]|uniref:Uncharacterized protein n=1 Tax=Stereocaulon virgatum TaxID=373712 RepID=A0ABR4AV04_9LECA